MQIVPPNSSGPAICISCRQSLAPPRPPSVLPHAPVPPHLRQPNAAGLKPDLKPSPLPPTSPTPASAAPDRPPAEPKPRRLSGFAYEIGFYSLLAIVLLGGIFLVTRYILYREDAAAAARRKDVEVFIIEVEAPPEVEEQWADASRRSVRRSGIKVRVDSFLHEPVVGRDARRNIVETDGKPYLQFYLNIQNQSAAPRRYIPWYGDSETARKKQRRPTLLDDQGQLYEGVFFAGVVEIKGQSYERVLEPKQQISDVLVFEVPDKTDLRNVKSWRLALPAEAVGGEGMFRFEVPRGMLQ